jgi:hypothetical protein
VQAGDPFKTDYTEGKTYSFTLVLRPESGGKTRVFSGAYIGIIPFAERDYFTFVQGDPKTGKFLLYRTNTDWIIGEDKRQKFDDNRTLDPRICHHALA